MDTNSIVEYIKKNYPKVVFKPFKLEFSKALGFIISDNKLVIGFINKDGKMCKLIEPVDLKLLSGGDLEKIISKIPIIKGFSENDKDRLLKIFESKSTSVKSQEEEDIIKELKQKLSDLENLKNIEYQAMYDSQTNKTLLIQKDHEDKLKKLTEQYQSKVDNLRKCKEQILSEKNVIINGINEYSEKIKDYIRSKILNSDINFKQLYSNINEEKKSLQKKLDTLLKNEQEKLLTIENNKDIISEYDNKLNDKRSEIDQLQNNIVEINEKLELLKKELTDSNFKISLLSEHKNKCKEIVLNEKQQIIDRIKEYSKKWNEWSDTIKLNTNEYRKKMLSDLVTAQEALKKILSSKDAQEQLSKDEYVKLKQNVADIEIELQKIISDQLIQLSLKDSQIKQLEKEKVKSDLALIESTNDLTKSQETIKSLKKDLEEVRSLLAQNNGTKIELNIDYENCYSILQNFFALNNIFFRKREIIKRLNEIIYENMGSFSNLNDTTKQNIKTNFEKVKNEINKHIDFLNLKKYLDSPDLQYLKSKATRNKVAPEFCTELTNILEYWNENKLNYREQDRLLTNIYEDLSGAVRVYIRIKPIIGIEQKDKTISIDTIKNKKQKNIQIDCKGVAKQFGEFYGIFEDTFTNLDVYTGNENVSENKSLKVDIDNIIESGETISPGLYNTFKQVQDGYSIVLFGYGLSGSGKTFSLLGNANVPGILHYGLTNLDGVSNIRLKYLFEQYNNLVNINFNKLTGKIHNLVREVPQLRKFSKDETKNFTDNISSNINLENLKVSDISYLTEIIDKYRINVGRIKKTPNNPVSSRSHLYFVFEITFTTGKIGYITIVDTAGRESPLNIYNTFIDTTKTKLPSIMAPSGGEGLIEISKRAEMDDSYTAKNIFEILKEGFYINETINHLIYYFNLKNYRDTKVIMQSNDPDKYNNTRYYIKPQDEMERLNEGNNCLMIPILKFLDNLSNKNKSDTDWRPTKFITLCCVRQEERYCDQTVETLEFAQTIKST
jgi:hypothetical protein